MPIPTLSFDGSIPIQTCEIFNAGAGLVPALSVFAYTKSFLISLIKEISL